MTPLAEGMLRIDADFIDTLEKFELVDGFSNLMGSGDGTSVEIRMICSLPGEGGSQKLAVQLAKLDALLEFAESFMDDIEIEKIPIEQNKLD